MSAILFDASIGKYRKRTAADIAYARAIVESAFPERYSLLDRQIIALNKLIGDKE